MLNSWLHVIALIVYVGAIIGLWVILLPALRDVHDHKARLNFLARCLRFYNPLHIGALGIVLFTGAFQLTELKATYRQLFVQQFGFNLGVKLIFVFLLVLCSVYQSMAIGHRFVRQQESGALITTQEVNSVIRRLKLASACIIFLSAVTLWLGFRLALVDHP
jgi:uncharacterized membrane protein